MESRGLLSDYEPSFQALTGDLASIPDEKPNTFVSNLAPGTAWIGGSQRERNWKWSDDSSWNFESWGPGQPDGGKHNDEHYVGTNFRGKGKWNDWNKNGHKTWNPVMGFVCQYKANKATTAPVQYQYWGTFLNVFKHLTSGGLFAKGDPNDALSKNADNPQYAPLFSILDQLENYRHDEGYFHFKICYNELPASATKFHKIFGHDSSGGLFFNGSQDEALWKNPGNPAAKQFSILKNIENFRGDDGKFHFKLCYPELTGEGGGRCNEWKQTSNPVTEGIIKGFEKIKLAFTKSGLHKPWGGLGRSETYRTHALMDDTGTHAYWYMAIG